MLSRRTKKLHFARLAAFGQREALRQIQDASHRFAILILSTAGSPTWNNRSWGRN